MLQFGEEEIRSVTESVWSSILGLEVRGCPEWVVAPVADSFLAGVVEITGVWCGAFVMYVPLSLARRAAGIMFGVEAERATSEQVSDALGELTNMTGGNLKGLLPGPSEISFPTVVGGATTLHIPNGRVILRVAFECDGEPFVVAVIEPEQSNALVEYGHDEDV
jgi:chemotaxis protein CheX